MRAGMTIALQLPARSAAFFFHRDAPALVAVKRLNTKRSILLGRGMKFLDLPIWPIFQ
jgi:hypothetical protein